MLIENFRPGALEKWRLEWEQLNPNLVIVRPSNMINATLYDKLSFNFIRDITPVASIMRTPLVMLVNPSVPAKTVP